MSARKFVSKAVPAIARLSGVSSLLSLRYRGAGTIFMLHSVVPDGAFHPDPTLRCSAATLERSLATLREAGLAFITLDQAIVRLQHRDARPFAVFTFDDGFADNLTNALPVMERHGAPFTVYVASGMMSGEIDAWWLGLSELIRQKSHISIDGTELAFDCPDPASKIATFTAIERRVHQDYDVLPAIRRTLMSAGIESGPLARAQALSADQLKQLAAHPLVTIGGHGETHINLAKASEMTVREEMSRNRAFLENLTQRPVVHFAYPFGNARACGPREAAIAGELGFRSAVTTRHGSLFPEHASNLMALPREGLSNAETRATLRCKIDGFYRAAHSRFGTPVAGMDDSAQPPADAHVPRAI